LPKITSEKIEEFFPCHGTKLYLEAEKIPRYEGDALDAIQNWVRKGKLSPTHFAWMALRPEFVPEDILIQFVSQITFDIRGPVESEALEAKGLYLGGEFSESDLEIEREKLERLIVSKEESLSTYRYRKLQEGKDKSPLLDRKIQKYLELVSGLRIEYYASTPGSRAAALSLFNYLCSLGKSYEKRALDMLESLLKEFLEEEIEAKRSIVPKKAPPTLMNRFKGFFKGARP